MSSTAQQQQLGRDCYARKDYTKAIAHFDRVINSRGETVSLLDQRAACHAQLKDLPAALKDARRTIHLAREDPTGYLRAAKVLVKMDKLTVARDLTTHGLKCVKHVGQGFEALQRMHETLSAKIEPARTDPFTVLPRELGIAILQMLDFRARVALMRTSKQWAGFVRSDPELWSHLDFTAARKRVPARFFTKVINRARAKITSASLTKYNIESADKFGNVLDALARHTSLRSLSLIDCGVVSPEMISKVKTARQLRCFTVAGETQIVGAAYSALFKAFPQQLEQIDIHTEKAVLNHPLDIEFCQLTALHLRLPSFTPEQLDNLQAGLRNAAALLSFTYHIPDRPRPADMNGLVLDLSHCQSLQDAHLYGKIRRMRHLTLPRSIRKLYVGSTYSSYRNQSLFRADPEDANPLPYHFDLPQLEDLEFNCPDGPLSDILEALDASMPEGCSPQTDMPTCRRLKRLCIYRVDGDVATLAQLPFDQLASLGLREIHGVTDAALVQSVERLPQLRALDVTASDQITGVAVKEVVEMRRVKELVLDECHNVGRDAVEWARTQGVRVQCRLGVDLKGGRTVRY